jgi:hypothetical protein
VSPKYEKVICPHDALAVKRAQLPEDASFGLPLLVHLVRVDEDFDGDMAMRLMVDALHDLAECPFAEEANDLETIGEVVADQDSVVMVVVIKS